MLSFWEASDGFTFEKIIDTTVALNERQINIWYVNFLDSWITTDNNGNFHFWDLLNHKVVSSFHMLGESKGEKPTRESTNSLDQSFRPDVSLVRRNKEQKESTAKNKFGVVHYLLNVTEIAYIKLLALSSTDKHIRIWEVSNIHQARIIFSLNLVKGGVHQVRFSNSYHVLLVAGYENSIPVFSITPKYYDINVVGRLVGHVSIITAMEIVENTPMILTADDTGCIKSWDMRSCQCFQTIELSHKTIICQLLSLENLNRVAFIGCRINFLDFDRFDKSSKLHTKQLVPIRAELNLPDEELVICTNSDMRFLDIKTGKIKKIYVHMMDADNPDEITVFRLMNRNHRFLLGDPKGDLFMFNYSNGEKLHRLEGHDLEIVDVKIDNYNKLIVSAGADSKILIQREKQQEQVTTQLLLEDEDTPDAMNTMNPGEALQKIKEEHENQNKNFKVSIKEKYSEKDAQPAQKKFETLRTISNSHHKQEILHLAVSVYHNFIATASVDNSIYLFEYELGKFTTAIVLDEGIQVTALEFINGMGLLLVCTNDGMCYFVEVASRENKQGFKNIAFINFKTQAQSFLGGYSVNMTSEANSGSKDTKPVTIAPSKNNSSVYAQKIYVSLSLKGENKDLEEFKKAQGTDGEGVRLNICEVYFTLQNGNIGIYDLTEYLKQRKVLKHSNTRLNYNPFRMYNEDCSTFTNELRGALRVGMEDLKKMNSLDITHLRTFFCHKGGVTSITLVKIPEEYLLTTGNDKYVKIITKQGECLCAWNVNHPLPLKWDLSVDSQQDIKGKMLFALKVIQSIFKRYYNMLYLEGKIFDLKGFISQYKELEDQQDLDNIFQLTQVHPEPARPPIKVMADEYKAKDFASGKLKDFYRQELVGPTLKQLEAKRRLILAQQEGREEEEMLARALAKKQEEFKEEKPPAMYFDEILDAQEKLGIVHKKSDRVRRLINDFRSVESRISELDKVSPQEKSNILASSIGDLKPAATKPAWKDHSFVQMSTYSKKFESTSKVSFLDYAKQKHIIDDTAFTSKKKSHNSRSDSVVSELRAPHVDILLNTTMEGKIRRMQKATRESNMEKMAFSKVLTNLNETLRQSQFKNLGRRTGSLPQIKPGGSFPTSNSKNAKMGFTKVESKKTSYNLLNF